MFLARMMSALVLCSLVGVASGQPADKAPMQPKPEHAQPQTPAKSGAPDMNSPEMQKMMEAWQKSSTPGPMQERLTKAVGEWDGKITMCMTPGGPTTETTAHANVSSMMGGRFTKLETTSDMKEMGKMTGLGLYGFNNTTQKFESVWMDSMGTMMMFFTGTLAADGNTINWTTQFVDPMTGKETSSRIVESITGPDSMHMEMYNMSPEGKEFKSFSIDYTRAKGGHDMSKPMGKIKDHAEGAKPANNTGK